MVIWKGWFETAPCRATPATPFPALCPRILGTRFTNYGMRMFWGELMVIWKGWFETAPCRATLNTPFSALCPRILGTRFTNYGLRMFWRSSHVGKGSRYSNQSSLTQKNPRVRKLFCPQFLGRNGCANFMGAWKIASFLQEETSMPINQNPPDRGQSRKIRFTKFPGSGLKKI